MAEWGFLVFFPCYYTEKPLKNNACGNHKNEAKKKKKPTRLGDSSLFNLALF